MSKWCLFASVSMWIFSEVFPLKAWSVICTSSSHQFSFIIYKVFLLTSVKYRFTEMAHWTIIGNIFSGSFSFLESGAKQTVKHKYMHQLRGYMTMTLGVCEQLYTQLDVAAIQRLQSSESLVSVLISGNQGWDGPDNWQVVNYSVPIKKKSFRSLHGVSCFLHGLARHETAVKENTEQSGPSLWVRLSDYQLSMIKCNIDRASHCNMMCASVHIECTAFTIQHWHGWIKEK